MSNPPNIKLMNRSCFDRKRFAVLLHEDWAARRTRCLVTLAAGLQKAEVAQITGIAGKRGFASITIEKAMMNSEVGFGRKVLGVFER